MRLLLDGVGSHGLAEETLREFQEAGRAISPAVPEPRPQALALLPQPAGNHRKRCKIIDGAIGFVGGMNIGREYEGLDPELGHWRDVQVEVAGSVASELQEVFADDWLLSPPGRRSRRPRTIPSTSARPPIPSRVVLGGPDRRTAPISKSIVSLHTAASDRVWIATGYFVPDDILLVALGLAASRGVDVRLLVSRKNEHPWLFLVGRSYYGELLAAGVRIFEYSAGINHAKIAVADRNWTMVGSANLDYRSMRLNFELNLLFHSPAQNEVAALILERDFALCSEVEPAPFARRPFRERLVEAALRPLSPLL